MFGSPGRVSIFTQNDLPEASGTFRTARHPVIASCGNVESVHSMSAVGYAGWPSFDSSTLWDTKPPLVANGAVIIPAQDGNDSPGKTASSDPDRLTWVPPPPPQTMLPLSITFVVGVYRTVTTCDWFPLSKL